MLRCREAAGDTQTLNMQRFTMSIHTGVTSIMLICGDREMEAECDD